MNWLLQWLKVLRQRLHWRNRSQILVVGGDDRQNAFHIEPRPNSQAPLNPALHAFQQIFATRHRAENQVLFRPVNEQHLVMEHTEEFFREGNTRVVREQKTKVVTCSGEIVPVEKLQGICWCGGYEDKLSRCDVCSRGLCRIHTRVFALDASQLILCDEHYREALNSFNTWEAMDRSRKVPR